MNASPVVAAVPAHPVSTPQPLRFQRFSFQRFGFSTLPACHAIAFGDGGSRRSLGRRRTNSSTALGRVRSFYVLNLSRL
jgi:hypothetical protein